MNKQDIDKNQEKLLEIAELFAQAEAAIKEVEDLSGNLIIPAVNQLRYAGNHLIRYISSSASSLNQEELHDALKHVKRATYDAYEAEIIFLLSSFQRFQNDYRKVVVSRVIPDYSDILKLVEETRVFIRTKEESKTRDDNYRRAKQYINLIVDYIKRLEAARDELNKLIEKERKKSFCNLIVLSGAIATIVMAIAAII